MAIIGDAPNTRIVRDTNAPQIGLVAIANNKDLLFRRLQRKHIGEQSLAVRCP